MPTPDKKEKKEEKLEVKLTFEELVKQEVRKQLKDISKELTEGIGKELEEVRRTSQAINSSLGNFECRMCSKGILHSMGGYYTDHNGYKFCSEKCLEKHKSIKEELDAKTNND
jgi:hypothetical protein